MTTQTAMATRYCWGCMRQKNLDQFKKPTRCRDCENEASRLRMRKHRARKKQKTQHKAISQFKLGTADQSIDDVKKAATALLNAYGGQERLTESMADLLNDPETPAETRFRLIKVLLTCLEAIDQHESSPN